MKLISILKLAVAVSIVLLLGNLIATAVLGLFWGIVAAGVIFAGWLGYRGRAKMAQIKTRFGGKL